MCYYVWIDSVYTERYNGLPSPDDNLDGYEVWMVCCTLLAHHHYFLGIQCHQQSSQLHWGGLFACSWHWRWSVWPDVSRNNTYIRTILALSAPSHTHSLLRWSSNTRYCAHGFGPNMWLLSKYWVCLWTMETYSVPLLEWWRAPGYDATFTVPTLCPCLLRNMVESMSETSGIF